MNTFEKEAQIQELTTLCKNGTIKKSYQFATSLVSQFNKKGDLSEKQWPFVGKMIAEAQAPSAKPQAMKVDGVQAAFLLSAEGKDRPRVWIAAEDGATILVSRAPMSGKNAGSLYVFFNPKLTTKKGEYIAKISPTDEIRFAYGSDAEDLAYVIMLLRRYAENPLDVMKSSGHLIGSCCVCGRKLTNPASVEAGIGPICAGYYA